MTSTHSDALVFFGATGDLACKKIFASLQAMVKRGHHDVPVVGVAKVGSNSHRVSPGCPLVRAKLCRECGGRRQYWLRQFCVPGF